MRRTEFIKSNKGGDKLCYKGHMYYAYTNKTIATRKRWECSRKIALKLQSCWTIGDIMSYFRHIMSG